MSDIKLTKAQREWLEHLATEDCWASSSYQPAVRLHALGLLGRKFGDIYSITPAGRAWLAANPRRKNK